MRDRRRCLPRGMVAACCVCVESVAENRLCELKMCSTWKVSIVVQSLYAVSESCVSVFLFRCACACLRVCACVCLLLLIRFSLFVCVGVCRFVFSVFVLTLFHVSTTLASCVMFLSVLFGSHIPILHM